MRFILETKMKLKITDVKFKTFKDWCLEDKKRCLDEICSGEWEETDQGIIVYGFVHLIEKRLKQIPFKFYRVEGGSFNIYNNLLISLINSPEYVRYAFFADGNKLQNLIGGPKRTEEGRYDVCCNQINSLEGAPEFVGDDFFIEEQRPPGKKWTEKEIREKIEVKYGVYT